MKKKNSYIELLRFIMCMVILIHHSGFVAETDGQSFFPSGTLAADFFFMVTGYFACAHLMRKESAGNGGEASTMKYWMTYTIQKLKRIFPYAAFGILIIYILEFFGTTRENPVYERLLRLQNLPFELSFTSMLGVFSVDLINFRNAPLWFLSSILVVLPLLMFLISKFKDVFLSYVVWFLPAILQAWMSIQFGGPCPWMQFSGLVYSGLIRGFASMMMGCAVYVAAGALGRWLEKANAAVRVLFTLLELGLLVMSVYGCHRFLSAYDEIAVLYIMELMLIIAMSGVSYTSRIKGKFFDLLGRISMPVYCIHWGVYQYVVLIFGKPGYWAGIGITLLCCLVLTAGLMLCIEFLPKKLKRASNRNGRKIS